MHVVIVISSLQAGGAERVAVTIANELSQSTENTSAKQNIKVTVCSLSEEQAPFYALSEQVNLVHLDLLQAQTSMVGAIKANGHRLSVLRKTLNDLQPSVVVSFMLETNVLTRLACLGSGYPLVVCEHTDPRFVQHKASWRILRACVYRFCDSLVVLNDYMRDSFIKVMPAEKINVIANPVASLVQGNCQLPISKPYILAAGRLIDTKQFAQMIDLFSQAANKNPQWTLVIAGDGPLKDQLQQQINQLGLQQRVILLGRVKNIYDWMAQAELFASTSTLEAFPMAICEAMASATPVLISAYNKAAYELVSEQAGIVTEQADQQWLDALQGLMQNSEKRAAMGKAAKEAMQVYSPSNITQQWQALFKQLLSNKG